MTRGSATAARRHCGGSGRYYHRLQSTVPGLSLRTRDGRWIEAPALDGHFLVNGGDMLRRWTTDRFLATPHRANNRSGPERYAIPFFFDCNIDWPMECLPTCASAERPAKYPRFTYAERPGYPTQGYGPQPGSGYPPGPGYPMQGYGPQPGSGYPSGPGYYGR